VAVVPVQVGDIQPIPLRTSDALYRIGQEALANAVRHAHPTTLNIALEYKKKWVRLVIRDNGIGFIQREDRGGFGVLGMRKRAMGISARLEISSVPRQGTQVSVTAPIPPHVAFASWPVLLMKFLREHSRNVTRTGPNRAHPYRG